MLENGFRALRADEVDVRIGMVKQPTTDTNGKRVPGGVSLLLYKDARCDMNVLDETVGPMNWQKSYSRDNANCTVSIWDAEKAQWISKEDTGTESYTEADKGLASDSFKRACFNWGIGRELYTAPFIWIQDATKTDKFRVKEMTVENHRITHLVITNTYRSGAEKAVKIEDFTFGKKTEKPKMTQKPEAVMPEEKQEYNPDAFITEKDWSSLQKMIKVYGLKASDVLKEYGISKPSAITSGMMGIMLNEIPVLAERLRNEQQAEG